LPGLLRHGIHQRSGDAFGRIIAESRLSKGRFPRAMNQLSTVSRESAPENLFFWEISISGFTPAGVGRLELLGKPDRAHFLGKIASLWTMGPMSERPASYGVALILRPGRYEKRGDGRRTGLPSGDRSLVGYFDPHDVRYQSRGALVPFVKNLTTPASGWPHPVRPGPASRFVL